jgi:cell division protein FtsQ
LIAAILVGVLAGATALYRSQLFEIRTVDVIGAERLTVDAIRSRAAVPQGATLLRFPAREIKQRLLDYAWIADAQVTRDFPNTLRIRVVERKPIAVVDTGETFWVVDSSGMVLGEQSLEETTTLPTIRDIPGLDLKAGRASTSEVLRNALDVLSGISAELRQKVRAVSAPSIDETMLLTTDNIEIVIGEAIDLAKKDAIVLTVMREKSGSVVTIDVRSTDAAIIRGLGE